MERVSWQLKTKSEKDYTLFSFLYECSSPNEFRKDFPTLNDVYSMIIRKQ